VLHILILMHDNSS